MEIKQNNKGRLIPLLGVMVCVLCLVPNVSGLAVDVEVKPHCEKSAKVCRFTWTLTKIYTMMIYNFTGNSNLI